MDAIIEISKIVEGSTKTKFHMSLMDWFMLHSRAVEKRLSWKQVLIHIQTHLWVKANHYIVWFHKIKFRLRGNAASCQVYNNVSTKYALCPTQKCI